MALDPNIVLQAGRGITPLEIYDPIKAQMAQANLANAMTQNQLLQANVEKMQAEAAANKQFQESYGMSPALAKHIKDMQIGEYQAQHAKYLANKEQLDTHVKQLEAADILSDKQLSALKSAQSALDKNPANAAQIHSQLLSKMAENAKNITPWVDTTKTDDPSSFMTTQAPFNPEDPNAPKVWDVAAQKAWLEDKMSQIPLTKQQIETRRLDIQQMQAEKEKGQLKETATGFAVWNPDTKRLEPVETSLKPKPTSTAIALNLPGGGLSPEALETEARNFIKTGQLGNYGMGAPGVAVRNAVMNKAAEIRRAENIQTTPAEAKALYSSDSKSLAALQKQYDAVTSFENTASKNLDLAIALGKKLQDTGSPFLNKPFRSISKNLLGSEDQAAFEAALRVANTEIAKVNTNPNLTGVLSDTARHEIDSISSPNATLGQLLSVAGVLKQDMTNRKESMASTINTVRGRISGGSNVSTQGGGSTENNLKYSGKKLPKATFDKLSSDDKKAFISGGGSTY